MGKVVGERRGNDVIVLYEIFWKINLKQERDVKEARE